MKPHPGQTTVIDGSRRFNVAACGRRFGKTTLGVNLAVETALDGKPAAWFAPQYKLLLEAWREVKAACSEVTAKTNEQEKRIELITGGSVEFWSLSPTAGRGRKYARVIVDEAAMDPELEETWPRAIRATLADLKGDAWFLSSPLGRNYFRKLYRMGQSDDHPEWASWKLPTLANPFIDPAEVEAAKLDMTAEEHRQEFGAEFLDVTSGSWFGRFSEADHVGEAAEYDPALEVVLGIDPGVHTGAVWLQAARRPDGRHEVRVFADYYGFDLPAEANARSVLAVSAERCGSRQDIVYADPAGGSRTAIGVTIFDEYKRGGLDRMRPWPNQPGSVIDSLNLLSAHVAPAAGPPRLIIHPRCTHLIGAMQDYRRKKIAGQWTDRPEDPQHPAEDMVDALRGALYAYVPSRREARVYQ
jgi:hypothetical protein